MNTKLQQAFGKIKTTDGFIYTILSNFKFKSGTTDPKHVFEYGRVRGKEVNYDSEKVNNMDMDLLVDSLINIAITKAKEAVEDL